MNQINQIKLNVGFRGEEKTGVLGEKPLGAEQRTNKLSPHMTPGPGHIVGRQGLSPLRHPCSTNSKTTIRESDTLEHQPTVWPLPNSGHGEILTTFVKDIFDRFQEI